MLSSGHLARGTRHCTTLGRTSGTRWRLPCGTPVPCQHTSRRVRTRGRRRGGRASRKRTSLRESGATLPVSPRRRAQRLAVHTDCRGDGDPRKSLAVFLACVGQSADLPDDRVDVIDRDAPRIGHERARVHGSAQLRPRAGRLDEARGQRQRADLQAARRGLGTRFDLQMQPSGLLQLPGLAFTGCWTAATGVSAADADASSWRATNAPAARWGHAPRDL